MKKPLKITFLDAATVNLNDLNMTSLEVLGPYRAFAMTDQNQVVARAKSADVLITNKCLLRKEEIMSLPNLKLICAAATGINNIDLATAQKRGIAVTNVAGYSTTTVAEHTLLFLLALAHRLKEHHHSSVEGDWSRSPHFTLLNYPFSDIHGKTLGIIGYGAIGKEVARLAQNFRMKILIAKLPGRKYPSSPKRLSLIQVLQKSDFVSLHCALTKETYHLINQKTLSSMKPSAILLNLARGPVVSEEDVAHALKKNRLAGYSTDVLAIEPPPLTHPLFDASIRSKVLMTPHIAWASIESRQRLVEEIAKNIQAFMKGKRRNRVD